jgi:hypothetical protein
MISFSEHSPVTHSVNVLRLRCDSCTHTHAILADILIPYGSYSLLFILLVLRDYFLRVKTVEALCLKYHISTSTLYAWIHLFHRQKALWLGVLEDLYVSSLAFLSLLDRSDTFTQRFFRRFGFSFLQSLPVKVPSLPLRQFIE